MTHAEVTDLAGRTVLPGINDSHLHAIAYGLDTPPFSPIPRSGPAASRWPAVRWAPRD